MPKSQKKHTWQLTDGMHIEATKAQICDEEAISLEQHLRNGDQLDGVVYLLVGKEMRAYRMEAEVTIQLKRAKDLDQVNE